MKKSDRKIQYFIALSGIFPSSSGVLPLTVNPVHVYLAPVVGSVIMKISISARNYEIGLLLTFGAFVYHLVSLVSLTASLSSAWPTPVMPKLLSNETGVIITEDEISLVVALSAPGFIVGSLVSQQMSDRLGRKVSLLASAVPSVIGSLIAVFAKVQWLLYVARFLWGMQTGIGATVVALYITEIADKEIRGTLYLITRVAFNFGALLIIAVGPFMSYDAINYFLLVLPVVYLVVCLWIPETPYFYLKVGKIEDARRSLYFLRGTRDKELIDEELSMMRESMKKVMTQSSSVKELFTGRQYRKAVIIVAGLKLAQMMTGGATIQQYLGRIMQESQTDLTTALVVFGIVRFVVGIFSTIIVDYVGRRPLFIHSFLGTGLSLFVVGIYFILQESFQIEGLQKYGYVPFAGIILSCIISNLGFQSIVYIVPAEIFPTNIKAVALMVNNIFGGILSFFIAIFYQKVKNISGLYAPFFIFGTVGVLGSIFVYFIVPETKGKSLEEIQVIMQGKHGDEIGDKNSNKLMDIKSVDDYDKEEVEKLDAANVKPLLYKD